MEQQLASEMIRTINLIWSLQKCLLSFASFSWSLIQATLVVDNKEIHGWTGELDSLPFSFLVSYPLLMFHFSIFVTFLCCYATLSLCLISRIVSAA